MAEMWLPLAVWMQTTAIGLRDRMVDAWDHRTDEDGVDEAVTKMIWLAVGTVVALAAAAFFKAKFNLAKARVPDPVAP